MLKNYYKDNIDDSDVEVPSNNKKAEEKFTNKIKENNEEEEKNENKDILEDEEENTTLSILIAIPLLRDLKVPYFKYKISEKKFVG